MKAIFKSFLKKILGLVPQPVEGETSPNVGVRLARLPFFLVHVLSYAILYFIVQVFQAVQTQNGQVVSIGEFGFTTLILIVTILLAPVYVRRAHDLGWSFKYVLGWAILPAFLRLVLLTIPLIALLNQELISSLFKIMPYIGFLYWVVGQIQILFVVILMFAPGTSTHNRYGQYVTHGFSFENLYGYRLLKDSKKEPKIKEKVEVSAVTPTADKV